MRAIQIAAALSGAMAVLVLTAALHPLRERVTAESVDYMTLVATVQLGCAAAALAIASRGGWVALASSGMMVFGSALLAVKIYLSARFGLNVLDIIAPIGGLIAVLGWLLFAFVRSPKHG